MNLVCQGEHFATLPLTHQTTTSGSFSSSTTIDTFRDSAWSTAAIAEWLPDHIPGSGRRPDYIRPCSSSSSPVSASAWLRGKPHSGSGWQLPASSYSVNGVPRRSGRRPAAARGGLLGGLGGDCFSVMPGARREQGSVEPVDYGKLQSWGLSCLWLRGGCCVRGC